MLTNKKLTYEFVHKSFESCGYTLVSKVYKNARTKLYYKCPKGHDHNITWNNWQQGQRCSICYGKIRPTLYQVRESFEKEDYVLLSNKYKNSKTKLRYICPSGHKHSITWGDWQQDVRCPYCAGKIKLNLKQVRESFEKEGYTLVSKEYISNNIKLRYICPNGHEHSITWNNWNKGARCTYCVNKNIKSTIEQIRESFEKEGYTLLSKEYINAHTKLNYICSKGHKHNVVWNSWQQGSRCLICAGIDKPTLEQVKKSFEEENYELLSKEYINNKTKLDYRCSKGHEHSITWGNWGSGYRCPTCNNIRQSINRSGAGCHFWRGGLSYEPYCPIWKDKEYKENIKERDNYRCLNPLCGDKDKRLHIHHIDYDKKNCSPSNLITLCGSCNSKANFNREWHTFWYQAILTKRYNYKY